MNLRARAIIIGVLSALLVGAAFVCTIHQSAIFLPQPHFGSYSDLAFQSGGQATQYRAPDGILLGGILYREQNPRAPYLLFMYGNADACADEVDRMHWLSSSLGYNTVCFDYRGYGYNGGVPDATKIRADVMAMYDYVVSSLDPRHRAPFVYAWSVGTQFALHISANRKIRALVLQAPPASADEEVFFAGTHMVGKLAYVLRPVPDDDVATIFQGLKDAASTKAPLLVIVGSDDEVTGVAQAREVFAAAASADKHFVLVPGAHHNDLSLEQPPAGPAFTHFLATH